MAMDMASEQRLRKLTAQAVQGTDLAVLATVILELQTADKFRIAAMLLDAGEEQLALTVGKRAVDEINLARLLSRK